MFKGRKSFEPALGVADVVMNERANKVLNFGHHFETSFLPILGIWYMKGNGEQDLKREGKSQ